jgi:peptidoglycan/xylan/chitin deacetylase (PgdA/CDA1 family)
VGRDLTIVMYHYVRDLARSRFPRIKGRDLAEFRAQLDHIATTYNVVSAEQVMSAVLEEEELPPRACWLTFDDGYADHYLHVLPLLVDRGWQGSFYVPSRTVTHREILDVNKVHFALASLEDPGPLVDGIRSFLDRHRARGANVEPFDAYWHRYGHPNRWDTAEVIFVKRMLQKELPDDLRQQCCDGLFRRFVTDDTDAFATELYLDRSQLRLMRELGMHLGSHGDRHVWLDSLDAAGQAADIDASLEFLGDLGVGPDRWSMCYPYGAYDETTLSLLRDRKCTVALTTTPGTVRVPGAPALALDRLDTNDLPVA